MDKRIYITVGDAANTRWRDSEFEIKIPSMRQTIYTGDINEFIFAVCTQQHSSIAIRFRLKGLINHYSDNHTMSGVISLYKSECCLEDIKGGLILTTKEVEMVNRAIDRTLNSMEPDFIHIK